MKSLKLPGFTLVAATLAIGLGLGPAVAAEDGVLYQTTFD
jgi:hypothetical protein